MHFMYVILKKNYNRYNCHGDVTIIPFAMGTHQYDHLEGALFVLVHFRALYFITNHFHSLSISIHCKQY
jgi:hypothetical protein